MRDHISSCSTMRLQNFGIPVLFVYTLQFLRWTFRYNISSIQFYPQKVPTKVYPMPFSFWFLMSVVTIIVVTMSLTTVLDIRSHTIIWTIWWSLVEKFSMTSTFPTILGYALGFRFQLPVLLKLFFISLKLLTVLQFTCVSVKEFHLSTTLLLFGCLHLSKISHS